MPRLFIDIAARFAQFQDALDKIERSTARTARTLETSFEKAGRSVKTLVSGFLILQGLRFAKGIIDDADQLHTLSQRTKIATEDLAGLAFAAKQSGTELDTFVTSIENLERAISGAGTGTDQKSKRLFEALGLKEAAAGAEDALETLKKIADIFPTLSPSDQTRVAMDLMKRSALELKPAFEGGRAGFEAMINEGKALAPNIRENARISEEFNDKIAKLGFAFQKGLLPAITAVLPILGKLADEMSEGARIAGGFGEAMRLFGLGINPLRSVAGNLRVVREEIEALESGIKKRESRGQDTSVFQSRLDDARKRLEFLKFLQRRDALESAGALGGASGRDQVLAAQAAAGQQRRKPLVLPPDPDKVLAGSLAALERTVDRERALYDTRIDIFKRFQTEGIFSAEELAEQSRAALDAMTQNTLTALDKQIAAIKKFKADTKGDADAQLKATQLLTAAEEKKEEVRRRAEVTGVGITLDQTKATRDYEDRIKGVTAALLELEGKTAEAIKIRFEIENRDLLQGRGVKPEDRERVQRLGRAQESAAQLRRLEGDAGRIQTRLAATEERARIQHELGATTELVSMQRISDARQEAVRDLEAVAAAMAKVAVTEEQKLGVEALRLEIEKLAAASDLVRERFETIFSDASSNSLVGLMEGRIRTMKDLLTSFGNDVFRAINDIVARAISQQTFGPDGPLAILPALGSAALGGGSSAVGGAAAATGAIAGGAGSAATAATAKAAAAGLAEVGGTAKIASPALGEVGVAAELASGFITDLGLDALVAGEMASLAADAFVDAAAKVSAGSIIGAAKGRVFDRGLTAFARGDVFSAPTIFKFAQGGSLRTGVMGEAGPEAVMPLKRGRDGKLGVAVTGGGTISVVNHFTLAQPADARTQAQIARQAGMGVARAMRRDG